MNIHAIHTREDHARAVESLRQLWDTTSPEERKEFDLLFDLVEAYERRHYPTPLIAPNDSVN